MSAWVVEKNHIKYLVGVAMGMELQYRFQGQTKTIDDPIHIANTLWDANKTSVEVLNGDQRGWYKELQGEDALKYNYSRSEEIDPIYEDNMEQVFKACQCLECMSNEFNAWQDSEAYAILSALKLESAERIVTVSPTYTLANWGSGEVFQKR